MWVETSLGGIANPLLAKRVPAHAGEASLSALFRGTFRLLAQPWLASNTNFQVALQIVHSLVTSQRGVSPRCPSGPDDAVEARRLVAGLFTVGLVEIFQAECFPRTVAGNAVVFPGRCWWRAAYKDASMPDRFTFIVFRVEWSEGYRAERTWSVVSNTGVSLIKLLPRQSGLGGETTGAIAGLCRSGLILAIVSCPPAT